MRQRRVLGIVAMGVVLAGDHALAQAPPIAPAPAAPIATAATPEVAEAKAWSFSAFANTYLLPDERDYVQPAFTADRGRLHLEARYNYEGREAGSAWIGYNWSLGEKVAAEITPMLGGVFGDTTGIAPGYKLSLGWRKLELTSESEYVFDTGSSSDSFFYTWSELGWAPLEWFRFGLVVQRTKAYETDFDIQRGFLVGFAYKRASFTTYVFNPDASRPTVVLGVGVSF
jgi:hypothetical protein